MGLFGRRKVKRKEPAESETSNDSGIRTTYRGVQVQIDDSNCCEAVRAIVAERFLVEHAPFLPLADCDVEECRCVYRHFEDRRTDARRASDIGFDMGSEFRRDDRRSNKSRGRRRDD